jgi:hypothetical protein
VFCYVLFISVTETFVTTYSSQKTIEKEVYYRINEVKDLEKALEQVNRFLYKDNERQFKLVFKKKNVFRKAFSKRESLARLLKDYSKSIRKQIHL